MDSSFVVYELDHSFKTRDNHVFDSLELANKYISEHSSEISSKGCIPITREVQLERVDNYQVDIIDKGLYENFKKNGCIIKETYNESKELISKKIEELNVGYIITNEIVDWYYSWIKFI